MIVGGTPTKPYFSVYEPTQEEIDQIVKLNILLMTFDLPLYAYIPVVPCTKGVFRLRKRLFPGNSKLAGTYPDLETLEQVVHSILSDADLLQINQRPGRLVSR